MQIHFPACLRLRVPRGLPAAVQQAAKQRHTTPSEWIRQTVIRGLEAEGVHMTGSVEARVSRRSPREN
jgi:hypothetical protein